MITKTERRPQQSQNETSIPDATEDMFTLGLALVPLGINIHIAYNPDTEIAHITYEQTNGCMSSNVEHPMSLEDWEDLLTRLDAGEALTIS